MGTAESCVHISIHDVLPGNSTVEASQAHPDVIIPDALARPLLVSSNLMLVTATLALARRIRSFTWPLAAAAFFVWVTSLLHWHAPRFSSWRRKVDYVAVCAFICVGTWLAIAHARSAGWTAFYFVGLAVIGIIFTCTPRAS